MSISPILKNAVTPSMDMNRNLVNNSNSIAHNISSVLPASSTNALPLNGEGNIKTETPNMNKEDLHNLNVHKQASIISELLNKSGYNITAEIVMNALNFGGMGNITQQAMHYRPESSLIILTLLEPHEMADGLLESAANMVQSLNQTTNDNFKATLQKSLEQFDKKIQKSLSGIKGNHFLAMGERFKEVYVRPEFKNVLKPHLSVEMVEQLSMDNCLLSEQNKHKQAEISVLNSAYQNAGNGPSVDKAHYMHNMFSVLEESLEIVKTLKVQVNWEERAVIPKVESQPLPSPLGDEVDGARGLPQSSDLTSSHISGSYNTTNNYYFSSPLSENITKISHEAPEVDHSSLEESKQTKQSEAPVLAPVKNQFIAKLSHTILSQPAKEPEVDYEFPKVDNSIYQSKGFVASTLRGNQDTQAKVKPERQSAKQEAIQQFLPKNGHLLGSYLRNGEVPTKVTLSTEGALTRSQSDKEIYRGTREATKVVVDTASYLPNSETPVTLTERGALTRDQSKKDAYTTGQ
ncbi:hypothetical protein [Providencia sp. PROV197]|uniref:hypothetical protein n=1 Tax=Providencia sp. PROV197 TaxID=2949898 RepID=UPI0023493F91|nr:hypothetical protein [Providencia sp. PROV197]